MYPNLSEIIKYHPYHISTFAGFAEVTTELFEATLEGEEELMDDEMRKIARYAGIPVSVLRCPQKIMLDKHNLKHQKMIADLLNQLPEIAEKEKRGSKTAADFMRYNREGLVNLELAFLDNRASYGQYLGAKERVDQTTSFIRNEERKPRGREKETALCRE